MASSILSAITGLLGEAGVRELARSLGQPIELISKGLASSVAAIMAGLAKKSDDPAFMREIFDAVSTAPTDVNVSQVITITASSTGAAAVASPVAATGKRLLSTIFGDEQYIVNDVVAKSSGLDGSTVTQLMGFVAPLLLAVLGRRVRENALTPSALRSHLLNQGSITKPAGTGARAVADSVETLGRPASHWRWSVPLATAALLVMFWLANRGVNRAPEVAQFGPATASMTDEMRSRVAGFGDFITRRLPNNLDLRIPERGVEARLLSFLQSSAPVDDESWFDFDRLLFDTGSATLRPESQEQLQSIASILEAYPSARIRIGGYTDNTGSPDANLKLSHARANTVLAQLARLGVSSSRMEAEGHGQQHPVADNSTEEGRAKNRRISMRVTQK
jgi:outer membrane protein OmpA-like peptidoglycan-associated protein